MNVQQMCNVEYQLNNTIRTMNKNQRVYNQVINRIIDTQKKMDKGRIYDKVALTGLVVLTGIAFRQMTQQDFIIRNLERRISDLEAEEE